MRRLRIFAKITVQPIHILIIAMTNSTEPTAILSHLHRADGSATFSQNGYTVIGAVNGPIEVQRRDELPEEAAIDVIVRPAAGVGGIKLVRHSCYSFDSFDIRYTGKTPRIDPAIYAPPNDPNSQLPPNLDTSHTPNHKHPGR
jgi:hypothetical protein